MSMNTELMISIRGLVVLAAAAPLALGVLGCEETVSVTNLPGHVTFIGPQMAAEGGVVTWFGVADPEGDLVAIEAEVCIEQECVVPDLLPGSATIDTLPTTGLRSSAALRLLWLPECDMMDADTPFTVHIRALGADDATAVPGLTTEPTTLAALGYTCPAAEN